MIFGETCQTEKGLANWSCFYGPNTSTNKVCACWQWECLELKLSDLITPYETILPHQESSRMLGWWNLYLLYPSIKKNSAAHYLEPKSGTRRHSFNNLQLHYWLEGKREGGGSLAANHDIRIIYSLPTEVTNKNNSVIPKLSK